MTMQLDSQKTAARAKEIYTNGLCCSEAIVYALAEAKNPEKAIDYMKMASGLCGGMGVESACGVVTGGACGIGIYLGRDSLEKAQEVKCSGISKQFVNGFRSVFNETGCKELKALIPEGQPQRDYCAVLVEKGTELAADIINRNNSK